MYRLRNEAVTTHVLLHRMWCEGRGVGWREGTYFMVHLLLGLEVSHGARIIGSGSVLLRGDGVLRLLFAATIVL